MFNTEILQDILTDHKLCNTQREELEKAIQVLSKADEIDKFCLDRCQEVNRLNKRLENSIELPYKIGDGIYFISPFGRCVCHGKVSTIKFSKFGIDLELITDAGNIVKKEIEKTYKSEEEAEKALAERQVSE